jgi:hypothetical protein
MLEYTPELPKNSLRGLMVASEDESDSSSSSSELTSRDSQKAFIKSFLFSFYSRKSYSLKRKKHEEKP